MEFLRREASLSGLLPTCAKMLCYPRYAQIRNLLSHNHGATMAQQDSSPNSNPSPTASSPSPTDYSSPSSPAAPYPPASQP
jgi:hypothetical protein